MINRQGQFPAVTASFNLAPGNSLGHAVDAIEQATRQMGLPASIRATFQGTAQAFKSSLANEPLLILAALITVYIVLGVLYESFIHPITILSTLPSAGVGAVLSLMICGQDLTVIAIIGIILLIGIVKKNGIMMVDFALDAERNEGKPPEEAIYPANHDDHHGRLAGCPTPGHRDRCRFRTAASFGDRHYRRPGDQSDPDPLHHPGDLSGL